MKKELTQIFFTLATLLTATSYSQTQQNVGPITTAVSEQEFTELSKDNSNECVFNILKNKKASQLLNVKQDYNEYIALEVNTSEWQKASQFCGVGEAYIEILLNAKNQKAINLYRLRYTSYVNSSLGYTKLNLYTPYMNQEGFNNFIKYLRSSVPVKEAQLGNILAKLYFQKVTVKTQDGQELVLTSVEDRVNERTVECQNTVNNNEETYCEDVSYAFQLNWIYNQYISYTVIESLDGSKYDASVGRIVSISKSKVEPIKDIRDIFSETSLLTSLKKDWIIRNSNQWTKFSQAKTWDEFWRFTDSGYYSPVSIFQSYSNKLNQEQIAKVEKCAQLAEKSTKTNSGFSCVTSKNGPSIYMFNYRVESTMLQTEFEVSKMDTKSVFVKIPLYSESTGSSFMQIAIPKKATDYFKSFTLN